MKQAQQLYFYCSTEEQRKFTEYSIDQGCKLISEYTNVPVAHSILFDELDRYKAYLCPTELMSQVDYHSISSNKYSVTFTVSPVIEFDLSVMRDKKLSRGRLYVNFGFDGRDGWVAYPDILSSKHKKIVSYLKRKILTKERYLAGYLSHNAKTLLKEGWELSLF
jgi:hypothetical protein